MSRGKLLAIGVTVGVILFLWWLYNRTKHMYPQLMTLPDEIDTEEEVSDCNFSMRPIRRMNLIPMTLEKGEIRRESFGFYTKLLEELAHNEKEFITGYMASLKTGLEWKLNNYTSAATAPKVGPARMDIDNMVDESKTLHVKRIISTIKSRLSRLSYETVRENFQKIISGTHGFNRLIGRRDIKNQLAQDILAFRANPIPFYSGYHNIILYGGSGIGKTKLANTIAYIFCKSGILVRHVSKCVTKKDLTSPYKSQGGKQTISLLYQTLEGVLFIDEAYMLGESEGFGLRGVDSQGEESIGELVAFMSENVGRQVIIAAGYEDRMKKGFLDINEGLDRRFPVKIHLQPYTAKELAQMLIQNLMSYQITLSDALCSFSYTLISQLHSVFDKQAGDIENLSTSVSKFCSINGVSEKSILDGVNEFLSHKGLDAVRPSRGSR